MTTVNGTRNNWRSPTSTTLDELLKDDRFGFGESQRSKRSHDEQTHLYHASLKYFVRGHSKDCLEKMYESGLLQGSVLSEDDEIYALFQGACDTIKNFNNLGFRLQDVIKSTFNGNTDCVKNHIRGKSKSFEIGLLNKYYRCCIKVLQMDSNSDTHGPQIRFLEKKIRKDIGLHSSIPLSQDPDSIVELQHLVETYIFDIEIDLLREEACPSLYQRLCEASPGLSQNLRTLKNGRLVEERIIDKLMSRQRQSKRSDTMTNPSRPMQRDGTLSTPKPQEQEQPPQPQQHDEELLKDQTQEQAQLSSRWVHTCYGYIKRLDFSRQTLIITLLLFIVSTKRLKGLSRVPRYIAYCAREITPSITNLLRLLSSI